MRAQRNDAQLEIEVSIAGQRYKATTRNLSLGGVLIDSDLKLEFNTRVQLRFTIPNQKEPVEVGGVVRWSDAGGFGVQFDGLRARDVWALGRFLEQV